MDIEDSLNHSLFKEFQRFATQQIYTGDLDPLYPVLKNYYHIKGFSAEQALWFTFLYTVWYKVSSAHKVFSYYSSPQPVHERVIEQLQLPTGVERRGFRGNTKSAATINYAVNLLRAKYAGDILTEWTASTAFFAHAMHVNPLEKKRLRWRDTREQFESIPGNGPWASYKWADLLKNVHNYPIEPGDLGNKPGAFAGPLPGLGRLLNTTNVGILSDVEVQQSLYAYCLKKGIPFRGMDQLETALCDFNSLASGKYYLGHDIDLLQTTLEEVDDPDLWDARSASFRPEYLGEKNGWRGVRKQYKRAFERDAKLINNQGKFF